MCLLRNSCVHWFGLNSSPWSLNIFSLPFHLMSMRRIPPCLSATLCGRSSRVSICMLYFPGRLSLSVSSCLHLVSKSKFPPRCPLTIFFHSSSFNTYMSSLVSSNNFLHSFGRISGLASPQFPACILFQYVMSPNFCLPAISCIHAVSISQITPLSLHNFVRSSCSVFYFPSRPLLSNFIRSLGFNVYMFPLL